MKSCFFPALLFLFLVTSCPTRQAGRVLSKIETFIQQRPDSALAKLESMDRSMLRNKSLRARHALLLSMALDKSYIDIADDSIARIAVKFYSVRKDREKAMLSWYYLGRVQMNGRQLGDAAVSMTKAGRYADNPHWEGLIYRNLGDLYSQCLDTETAASFFERSEQCFREADEPNYAAYSAFNHARCLYSMERRGQADSIWTFLHAYSKEKDPYLYSQLLLAEASLELSMTEPRPDSVISKIKSSYRISRERYQFKDLANLALAYSLKDQRDSAELLYSAALSSARSVRDSAKVYAVRYRMEDHSGNLLQADKYLQMAISIQNDLMNKRESMAIANCLEKLARDEEQAVLQQSRKRMWTSFSALSILILLILFLVNRIRLHRKTINEQKERIQEDMVRTGEILEQLEQIKDENDSIHRQIRTTILDQILLIKRWADAYYGVNAPKTADKRDPGHIFDEDYVPVEVKKEEIIKQFCHSLEDLRSNDTLFRHLEENVNLWKDNLMVRAREICHEPGKKKQTMDESDFKTMMLMFAEVPDKSIAYLMNLSNGAVRMRRLRYKEFFGKLPEADAADFIKALTR